MTESTISRERLLTLMREWGQAGSIELVAETLAVMGWGDKQAFTKQDVVDVMAGVTQVALRQLETPAGAPGVDDEARDHMRELLGSIQAHAIPVLKRHPVHHESDAGA